MTVSPLIKEISLAVRKSRKPFMVAATTDKALFEPSDFDNMFLTPAASRTARTPPPAMIPVPFLAGFRRTLPPSKLDNIE